MAVADRRKRERAARREAILKAACGVLISRGVRGTTTKEIAEHCGFRTADQARNCIAGIRSKRGTGVLVSRRGGGYYRPDAEPSQEELSRPRPRRSRTAPR